MPEYEVIEFARTQLTLPDKLDPADEMSWQHYLYSKLGKKDIVSEEVPEKAVSGTEKNKEKVIEETVERIVAMAKVLYGLHMVSMLGPSERGIAARFVELGDFMFDLVFERRSRDYICRVFIS